MSHSPWFCVAGVALMALGGALGPVLVALGPAALCHTPSFATPFFTHHFVTHHFVSHNFVTRSLSHTTFTHTIFVTHHLSHTIFDTLSLTHPLSHTIFHTHTLSHTIFVTHHLSHTTLSHALFRTQLSHTHTPSFTHNFVTHNILLRHTPSFSYNFFTHAHNFVLLVGPPPHPLSFLLSPSPLQHVVLIVGRSCLVGLSGPLIGVAAMVAMVTWSVTSPTTAGCSVV